MVTESTNHISGVAVIVGMTTEGRIKAKFSTFLGRSNVLINGVDRLEDAARNFLELAKLHRLINTVILEIVDALHRLQGAGSSHGQSVHV
jgi:hypothetical protein